MPNPFDQFDAPAAVGNPFDQFDAAPFDSLVSAIRGRESGGNPNAISPQGAKGSMQIMPATFKEYAAPGESFDNDEHRTNAALRKLRSDFDFYGGDVSKTAAAYLGGRGAVRADGTIRDDVKDAHGTTPAAYADQVVKRMGGSAAAVAAGPSGRKNVVGIAFPSQGELKPIGTVESAPAQTTELGGWDTAKLIGGQILDAAAYHLPAAFAAALEGDDPYAEKDWKDSLIERSRERSKSTGAPGDKEVKTALPGVSAQDVKQLGPSLGFSGVGAGAGLAAGVPAGIAGNLAAPAVGTVAGYTAGMAASGAAAYRMATNQFVRDLHDAANDDSLQRTGKPISDAEFQQKQAQLAGLIKEYGLWEAVPEAAGNAIGFGILKAPVKGAIGKLFGSNILTRLASKMGALYGEELATETVTQQGQHNVEVDAGLSKDPRRSWTSPEDWAKSFQEVAPSTVLQTTMMAGGAKAGMKLYDRMKGTEQGSAPAAAPGDMSPDSVNVSDLYGEPEATGSQFANSEPVPVQPEAMGMQNRDRGTAASILQMQSIANAPDFDRLGASPIPDVGAPLVSIKDNAEGAIAPEDLGQGGEVTLPDGSKVGFHYAVVDADVVQASHDAAGNVNPAYADAPAGTVVALNNGRTAGLQAAYATGTAAQPGGYRDRLMSEAQSFGIDPQAIAGKASPILVRIYDDAVNARPDIARQANSGGSMGMSAQEVARNDAAVLPDLRNLVVDENGEFDPRANAPFVRGWVGSLPQSEQAQVTDRGGNLSQVGATRLRNAIIARAYGDNSVFGRLVESLDDNMRNVGRALVKAAPKIAQVRELIAAGAAHDLDIGGEINRAVDDLVKLRQAGMSLADFLAQANLFAEQKTAPEVLEILAFLDANLRSPNRIADFLAGYYAQVEAMGSPQQGDIFGAPQVGRSDLIRNAAAATLPAAGFFEGNHGQRDEPGRADSGSPGTAGPVTADAARTPGGEVAPAVPGADGPGGEARAGQDGAPGGSDGAGQPAAVEEEPKTAVGKEARKLKERAAKTRQPAKSGEKDQGDQLATTTEPEKPADGFGSGNNVFTADRAAKARELLRKKLGQVNSGLDPEMVQAGIELAGFYIEGGARKFADYAGKMVADLGEAARPYLKSWYLAVRNYPGFDNAGMESEAELEAAEKRTALKADIEKIKAKREPALAYADGQVLPFDKVDGFLSQYVYGREKGDQVPNPTFIVGQLSAPAIETIGEFIDGFGEQYSTVRVGGRSLKHTDEQRHDLFSAVVGKLPEILAAPDLEVLHNPSREASAFIVYRRPKVEGPNALVVIEIAKNGNGTDIVNMISAGDRQVRQFEKRSAEWLEGRHSLIPAAERSPAGGEVSDVQPLSTENVASDKAGGNTVDVAAREAATSPTNGKPAPTPLQQDIAKLQGQAAQEAAPKTEVGKEAAALVQKLAASNPLAAAKLKVTKTTTKNGSDVWEVSGDTKANSDLLKRLGGRWYGPKKVWSFYTADPTDKIAKALNLAAPEPVALAENEVQLPDIKEYIYGKVDGAWHYKAVGAKYEGYAGKITAGPLPARLEAALREKRGNIEPAAESPTMTNEGAKDNGQPQQLGERAGRAETGNDQGSREPGPAGVRDSGPVGERLEEENARAGSERGTPAEAPGTGGSREGSAADDGARGRVRLDGRDGVPPAAGRERGTVTPKRDFTITDDLNIGAGGQKTKYQDNVAAIRLLKQLESESRQASPDEQKVLARYVGWGGLKGAFDLDNKQWAKEYAELKELLTPEEYAAARRTILDAHYTSVPVVRSIWSILERLGFAGGRVLEPSVGIGNFIGLMPRELRAESNVQGVELDSVTARIAAQLYQKERIVNRGFQDLTVADGHFDAAVGNPPFGSQTLFDENHKDLSKLSIHNFFIAKSLLKTRPGGVAAFVVSRYFLDAQDPAARQAIAQHGRFVGAVRLPYTAFKENAGTEVVTDIVVFQRLAEGEKADSAWTETGTINVGGNDVQVNRYFIDNPGQVLGKWSMTSTMYSANQLNVIPDVRSLEEDLARAVDTFPQDIYRSGRRPVEELASADAVIPEGVEVGGLFVGQDGKIAQRLADMNGEQRSRGLEDMGEIPTARARGMIAIRDALLSLMRAEMQGAADDVLTAKRQALNAAYDGFVKKYGYLNALSNRRSFQEDPRQPLLEALEAGYDPGVSRETARKRGVEARSPSANKAAIFSRRVLAPYTPVTHAGTAKDALVASLAERGKVDMPYMSSLYGKPEEDIAAELGDMVYRNPETNRYEVADEYLSGNVKAKLAQAREAAAADKAFERNVTALEAVQPKDIPAKDIFVRMGAPWIPGKDIVAFAKGLIGEAYRASATYIPAVGRWSYSGEGGDMATVQSRWGTSRVPFSNLMDLLLNGRPIIVKDNIGTRDQPKWVVNDAETEAARAKGEDIAREFGRWIWDDPDRRARLEKDYNDRFNTDRDRDYDGSHLSLPGASPLISLRKHQKDGIWRILQDRIALMDHVVGAGKSMLLTGAAMELRRLGFAKKPMFVVPNHLVRQWRDEFYKLYPAANILVATEKDFEKANRQRLFGRIATGDWDAVIVAHSSFKKVGMPKETEAEVIGEMAGELSSAIEATKRERGDRNVIRDMERIKENLDAKIKKLNDKGGKKDAVATLDELGVDALFVDEAHAYKNLFFFSQMQNVAGLGSPAGSGRAFDMFVKLRYLERAFGGKAPVVFATGTPVSNSLVEMFTMQRYLAYDELKRRGIHLLDPWANTFGDAKQVYEVHPSGNGYRLATRFAQFVNMGELMQLYGGFADVITLDDLKKQAIARGERFPVPKLKGGKPQLVVADRSEEQTHFFGVPEFQRLESGDVVFELDGSPQDYSVGADKDKKFGVFKAGSPYAVKGGFESAEAAGEWLHSALRTPKMQYNQGSILWKFENLKQLNKDTKGKVNALSITNEARKAGLDFRLIDAGAPDFKGSKINLAAKNLKRIYDAWHGDKGTQLVFCDLSVPKSAAETMTMPVFYRQDGKVVEGDGRPAPLEGMPDWSMPLMVKTKEQAQGEDGKKRTRTVWKFIEAHTGLVLGAGSPTEAQEQALAALPSSLGRLQSLYEARGPIAEEEIEALQEGKEEEGGEEGGESVSLDQLMALKSKFSVYEDLRDKLIKAGIPQNEIAFIHDYDTAAKKQALFKEVNAGRVRVLLGSTEKMGAGMNVQERIVAIHHLDAPWRPSDLEQRNGRMMRQGNQLYLRDPDGFEVEELRYATKQTYDTRMWQIQEHKARGVEQLRAADKDTRTIEDVAGDAANAADMKAAASGNPLILDEIKLRNEVSKFENLERAYQNGRWDLQNRERVLEGADRREAEGMAEIKPWLLARDENPADPFEFTIDGKKITDKKELAGPVIEKAKAAIAAGSSSQRTIVGTYRGVTVGLVTGYRDVLTASVSVDGRDWQWLGDYAKGDNFSPVGLLQRIDNRLAGLDERVKEFRAKAEKERAELPKIRAELAKPFEHEQALAETRQRHRAVVKKLQEQGGAIEMTPEMKDELRAALGKRGIEAKFARVGGGRGTIHLDDLHAVAATFRAAFPSIPVVVLEQERQAPKRLRQDIRDAGATGTVAGAYHEGTIYLIREAIRNVEHAEHVVLHEGVHGGLRQLFGQAIEPVMLDIWKNNLKVQLAAKKIREQYGYSQVRAIEEALADMGSTAPKLKGWERLVGWVRAKLRKLGFVTAWTDKDIDALVQRALSTLKQGGRQTTVYSRTAFSRTGQAAQGNAAQDIDAKVAAILSKRRSTPAMEAVLKGTTKAVGLDRATAFAGAKVRQLLDALVPEGVKAGMVSDYGVPEAVTDRRDVMFGHMRRQLREVENTLVRLSSLTRQESRIAYEWMNNRNADHLLEQLPEESRQVLQELKRDITEMGQEAVRLGQLDHDTFERHAMAYLHRSYRKWDLEASDGEKRTRARAIKVLGDQYKGRGLTDLPAMTAIKNAAPEWWNRKIQKGKADKQLRGQKFIRFERRANRGEGAGVLPGMDDSGQLGRLQEVNYWPANEPVPARYAGWHNAQVWEARGTKGEKVVMWRDFTTDERATMGEIDEVRFAVAKTMHKMVHDLEVGKFFEWLAANQALPEDRLPRSARVVEARESMLATFTEDDWVQVPDSAIPGTRVKRYGKLAGLYVSGPVWNDVRQVANFKFNPLGEHYAAILKAWKISKTALSPAVHLNNIMANFVMADWHDVTWRDTLDALAVLVNQKDAAHRKILERFEDAGGTQGMYVLSEIQREQLAPLVDQLRKEVGIADVDGQIGAASVLQALMRLHVVDAAGQASMTKSGRLAAKAVDKIMDLYSSEDTVFRLAAFMKAKREGASDMEAGRAARKSFLDYQINAPWVQMMRQTAFPFLAFTYRAVPMLLNTIEKKPWKLMKLGLVLGAVNAIGYALSGGDEDRERRLLPEEKAGRVLGAVAPKLIRMPWNHEMKDTAGNKTTAPVFLDIRRFIPLGDIVDMGQTHSAVPVLPMALPGGPLAVLAELVANKSQFTGKAITQETDTGMEKAGKVFDHLYKAFAPNLVGLPGTYATTGVWNAGTGRTDAFGREQSLAMAGLSSVGVKVGAYPADVARMNLGLGFKADRAEIERDMRRNAREFTRKGMSEEEFREAMKRDVEKLQKRAREYTEKVQ